MRNLALTILIMLCLNACNDKSDQELNTMPDGGLRYGATKDSDAPEPDYGSIGLPDLISIPCDCLESTNRAEPCECLDFLLAQEATELEPLPFEDFDLGNHFD